MEQKIGFWEDGFTSPAMLLLGSKRFCKGRRQSNNHSHNSLASVPFVWTINAMKTRCVKRLMPFKSVDA
ncbi:hypothetical protein TNCV_4436721 [Trichonephila clavipes]|nr:hypothetical protein TNCV_4436721 [Trichonephila clavipes]